MRKKFKLALIIVGIVSTVATVNWIYQVVNNPAILLSMFAQGNYKASGSTWSSYEHLFKRHSTSVMTPQFLAALAQVESAGNPLVIPQWRWRLTTNVFKIYAPASTSAGLYQYTRPTFKDAKRFCIHNHKVNFDGPIYDFSSCWFNRFYSRFWPSHAIEMTSARLTYYVESIISKQKIGKVSMRDKHKLASIIHLCGIGKGRQFAKSGFQLTSVPKCGSHSTEVYLNRIFRNIQRFNSVS